MTLQDSMLILRIMRFAPIFLYLTIAFLTSLASSQNSAEEYSEESSSSALTFHPVGAEHTLYTEQSFFISCVAPSDATVHRIMWHGPHNDKIIGLTGRIHVEDSMNERSLDLVFESIQTKDKGFYTCTANVDGIEVTKRFNLVVFKPISFVDTPEIQYATEGSDYTVRCDVKADPPAKITLKRKHKHGGHNEFPGMKYQSVEEGLLIRNITRADAGEYKCNAVQMTATKADFKIMTIHLKVKFMPEWTEPVQESGYAFIGGSVNLTCAAKAEPPPAFEWQQYMDPIEIAEPKYKVFMGPWQSILQIRVDNEADFTDFSCIATNEMGMQERTILLHKADKPGVPLLTTKSSFQDGIRLEIHPPQQSQLPVTAYVVQYSKLDQDWAEARTSEIEIGNTYVLKNLEPNTEYQVRVAAKSLAGSGDFTVPVIQKTLDISASPITDSATAAAFSPTQQNSLILSTVLVFISVVVAHSVRS